MCKIQMFAVLVCLAGGCAKKESPMASNGGAASSDPAAHLTVTSPSFPSSGPIPARFTCEGEETSPALAWSELPAETKSVAVIVDDPDAPDPAAPKRVFVHWVLYDIAPSTKEIAEGAKDAAAIGGGARDGKNDAGKTGWTGPCPPKGRHRYFFKVYALDTVLPDLGQPTKAALEQAMGGHVLARGEVIGTYEKGQR